MDFCWKVKSRIFEPEPVMLAIGVFQPCIGSIAADISSFKELISVNEKSVNEKLKLTRRQDRHAQEWSMLAPAEISVHPSPSAAAVVATGWVAPVDVVPVGVVGTATAVVAAAVVAAADVTVALVGAAVTSPVVAAGTCVVATGVPAHASP